LANQLSREHSERPAIFFVVKKDWMQTAEVVPSRAFLYDTQNIVD
jgi:hypothetical protein